MVVGFFDGSSNPNPGKIGLGFSIFQDGKEVLCGAKPAGFGTNNEAEYKALVWLLEEAIKHQITSISLFGDSNLIVKQVNGQWSVGKVELQSLHQQVLSLLSSFEQWELNWIRRDKNSRADALSKRGAVLSEAKIHASFKAEGEKNVVDLEQRKIERTVVLPRQQNNIVILEKDSAPIYINVDRQSCSCKLFAASKACHHIEALQKVLKRA